MAVLQPRPLASLSSALLARKGHAKPAMRPQGYVQLDQPPAIVDDLGWNDMGDEAAPIVSMPPVLVERAALREEIERVDDDIEDGAADAAVPIVDELAAALPDDVAGPVAPPVPGSRKAAFTLRLDPARHLRLRLASASRGRSAQALVTQALDAFLATLPEVEELAGRLPSPGANQRSSG